MRSRSDSLRDEALSQIADEILGANAPSPQLFTVDDLGDAGARLRAAGVSRLLALPAGEGAWLFLESPDLEAALDLVQVSAEWPALDIAGLLAAEDVAADMRDLTTWWLADEGGSVPMRTSRGSLLANQLQTAMASLRTTGDESRRNALIRERARIASVIHEGITQVLTNVAIQLEVLGHHADEAETVRNLVAASRAAVLQALDSLRTAILDLTPPAEEWTDLVVGLRGFVNDFASQWGVGCRLEVLGTPRDIATEVVSLAFAFVQEGLTNVRKHARTDRADVNLSFGPGVVSIEVRDAGVGLEDTDTKDTDLRRHQGLAILASRVRLLNGRFHLDSPVEGGVSVRMVVPA
ncbi:MAG TPA: histidine kinase [Egicoccus sp.]|nr:histidine kinase [Egicoccus sp.]HSK22891.1 histidine kinase [Egicoccus sp.]